MHLEVIYSDENYIAINKPPGLLVHRSQFAGVENISVLKILRGQVGKNIFPVHRLDRATSGVLLFAFTSYAAQNLSLAFQNRNVEKTYLAVARGFLKEEIDLHYPLKLKIQSSNKKDVSLKVQEARTLFKPLAQIEINKAVDRYLTSRYSLVQAIPVTGRNHQIRRHLKHLGHPIIGDINYGNGKHNRFFADFFGCKRLLLACQKISFFDSLSESQITIKANLDDDFKRVINELGWGAFAES